MGFGKWALDQEQECTSLGGQGCFSFYLYEGFICIHACVPYMCLVPARGQKSWSIP